MTLSFIKCSSIRGTVHSTTLTTLTQNSSLTVIQLLLSLHPAIEIIRALLIKHNKRLEMWANAQRDGRPAKYSWRPLFNAAKFG